MSYEISTLFNTALKDRSSKINSGDYHGARFFAHPYFNKDIEEVTASINEHLKGNFKTEVVGGFGYHYNDGLKSQHAAVNNYCVYANLNLGLEENPISVAGGYAPKDFPTIIRHSTSCLYLGPAYLIHPTYLENNTVLGYYMIAKKEDVLKFYKDYLKKESYVKLTEENFKNQDWVYLATTNCERVTPSSKQGDIHLLNPIDMPMTPLTYLLGRAVFQFNAIKFENVRSAELTNLIDLLK